MLGPGEGIEERGHFPWYRSVPAYAGTMDGAD
jgi:hypothetical protein